MARLSPDEIREELARELDAKKPPSGETLYHYTNAQGLYSIIESGLIFATDFRFLNDRTEFLYGFNASKELSSQLCEKYGEGDFKSFVSRVHRFQGIESDERAFVTSFSENADDLSQWRGYANDGLGFTIGLDANWFINECKEDNREFGFSQVSYDEPDFTKRATAIIEHYFDHVNGAELSKGDFDDYALYCDSSIEMLCAFHKHPSFKAEREWRLVTYVDMANLDAGQDSTIKVRPRDSGLVPYTDMDLKKKGGKIPLKSIGVGPSFSNPATSQAVRDLCRNFGYDPDIYNADTPYQRT